MFNNRYIRLVRLHNISGALLLILPGIWSLLLATKSIPSIKNILIFIIGGFCMRGVGCIINDIIDRKIDSCVERTKLRPIAAGEVTVLNALIFAGILSIIPFLLILSTNKLSIYIAIFSIIPISIYPLMKRFTYWPQLFLGLVFNLGAILGWTISRNEIELPAILLYFACTFWILGFDTIYAFQDIEDDLLVGVKSTAIKFRKNPKIFIMICYTLFSILFYFSVGLRFNYQSAFIILVPFIYLFYLFCELDIKNTASCFKNFKGNVTFGILEIFALIIIIYTNSKIE